VYQQQQRLHRPRTIYAPASTHARGWSQRKENRNPQTQTLVPALRITAPLPRRRRHNNNANSTLRTMSLPAVTCAAWILSKFCDSCSIVIIIRNSCCCCCYWLLLLAAAAVGRRLK
jgi:hypothetical protein